MVYSGLPEINDDDFSFFQKHVLQLSGIHLTAAKKDLVRARLIARLTHFAMPSIKEYRQYLEKLPAHDKEWQLLINQITTNKTDFFREPAHFEFLTQVLLPEREKRRNHAKLRVWSAASSTGEEPYTIAMVLDHYFKGEDRFEVFASDIDTKVLALADNAVYPNHRLAEIPPEYQVASIIKGKGDVTGWFKIKKRITDRVRFSRINLIETNFFGMGNFDIILCRNVFIYFQPETIQTIIAGFAQVLNKQGALILGHSESVRLNPKAWTSQGPSVYRKELETVPQTTAATVAPRQQNPAPISSKKKKRVLIIDDAPTIRQLLTLALGTSSQLEVVGAIGGTREVEDAIRKLKPDVMTLDLKMPHMDGCQLLETILSKFSIPTVIVSAVSLEESGEVLRALELGAVDYIQKPNICELKNSASSLADRIYQASEIKVHKHRASQMSSHPVLKKAVSPSALKQTIIAIGSSTGGIQALSEVLTQLPASIPPILIVQHIPAAFSGPFATRLNSLCPFHVKEAKDGELVQNDQVLIAPGGLHMELETSRQGYRVRLSETPPVNRHKPSVDVLFDSVARHIGPMAIGVILTGMGSDGAKGLKKMKDAGARTIAQDEASCAVFGMPREAIRLEAVDHIYALDKIPQALIQLLQKKNPLKRA